MKINTDEFNKFKGFILDFKGVDLVESRKGMAGDYGVHNDRVYFYDMDIYLLALVYPAGWDSGINSFVNGDST